MLSQVTSSLFLSFLFFIIISLPFAFLIYLTLLQMPKHSSAVALTNEGANDIIDLSNDGLEKTCIRQAVEAYVRCNTHVPSVKISHLFVAKVHDELGGHARVADMPTIFSYVMNRGGADKVDAMKDGWTSIATALGFKCLPLVCKKTKGRRDKDGISHPEYVGIHLASFYRTYMGPLEAFWLGYLAKPRPEYNPRLVSHAKTNLKVITKSLVSEP